MTKTTSLSAGLAIKSVLSKELKKVTRIYPVVSETNATMPFVVYRRTGIQSNPTKVGNAFDRCTIQISVFSKSYAESVSLIEQIRSLIEGQRIVCTAAVDGFNMTVDCSRMQDCEEVYDTDCYRQDIYFECKIE